MSADFTDAFVNSVDAALPDTLPGSRESIKLLGTTSNEAEQSPSDTEQSEGELVTVAPRVHTHSHGDGHDHSHGCCGHCAGSKDGLPQNAMTAANEPSDSLPAISETASSVETLELTPAGEFNIEFNFDFDDFGFFDPNVNPGALEALNAAARIWESFIADDFPELEPGVPILIFDPATGELIEVNLEEPIDDLVIFVGARDLTDQGGPIAAGGPSGVGAAPSEVVNRLQNTGEFEGNFEPFAGQIAFEINNNWFFDTTPETDGDIPFGQDDFLSIVLHEIGHVLGFGTSVTFDELLDSSGNFTGPITTETNGNASVPIADDGFHFPEGLIFEGQETLMDPSLLAGSRTLPTPLDLAVLADIGYEITNGLSVDAASPIIEAGQSFSYAENQSAGFVIGTAAATDNVGITEFDFASGNEAGFFAIDNAGELTLTAAGAAGAANDFEIVPNSFTLSVVAQDAAGNVSDPVDIEIVVDDLDDVNDPPVFTSPATVDVAENSPIALTITASDDDPLMFFIVGGADQDAFAIEDPASGVLSFVEAPDFEDPGSANGNNLFEVQVQVSDGVNPPVVQDLEITITDVNEAPEFTSPVSVTIEENTTAVQAVAASDDEGDDLLFSIEDSLDGEEFEIDPVSGELTFVTSPDFEDPADSNGDNNYEISVGVSDGTNPVAIQDIVIVVTDVASELSQDVLAPAAIRASALLLSLGSNQTLNSTGDEFADLALSAGGAIFFDRLVAALEENDSVPVQNAVSGALGLPDPA